MNIEVGKVYYFGERYNCGSEKYSPIFIKILYSFEKRTGYQQTELAYNISECKKDGTLKGKITSWKASSLESKGLQPLKSFLKMEIERKQNKIEKLKKQILKIENEIKEMESLE